MRNEISKTSSLLRLDEVAEIRKPPGRYKTIYVDDKDYGVRLLSGRQIAQTRPIGLKYMSPKAFQDPDEYRIRNDWVLMTADGRAEESLADVALISHDRHGWMASGHVYRLLAKKGVPPGLLYLLCSCWATQILLKSMATGSVVDALNIEDVRKVEIAYISDANVIPLANDVYAAWGEFAKATKLEDDAVSNLEDALWHRV